MHPTVLSHTQKSEKVISEKLSLRTKNFLIVDITNKNLNSGLHKLHFKQKIYSKIKQTLK